MASRRDKTSAVPQGVVREIFESLCRGAISRAPPGVAEIVRTLGIVPHMVATITGLAALLHTGPMAFQILKYLGVAYLLFMAWTTVKDKVKDAIVVEQ